MRAWGLFGSGGACGPSAGWWALLPGDQLLCEPVKGGVYHLFQLIFCGL